MTVAAARPVVPGHFPILRPSRAGQRQRCQSRLRYQQQGCAGKSPDCPDARRLDNPPCSSSSEWVTSGGSDDFSQPTPLFPRVGRSRGSTSLASCSRRILCLATPPLLLWARGSSQYSDANAASQEVESEELIAIRSELRKVLSRAKAPGVLRLAFHDAGTFDAIDNSGGMNGSIVLELDRPENAGLKKSVKVLGKAKTELDNVFEVSWADLIAVAGAEAVALCGGPSIPVRLGRMDASMPDPEGRLPEETLGAGELKKCFAQKGFSAQELVALSGAHTIGGKGFGSPVSFDNAYFKILLDRPWVSSPGAAGPSSMSSMIGLPSDRALAEDDECLRWINTYAADEGRFFQDFNRAYLKLVNTGVTWTKPNH